LIIAHHPLIFGGIKKLNRQTETGRCLIKAIKKNVAIYAAHTNLDSVTGGVNSRICEKLGLKNCRILSPLKAQLRKLVTFIRLLMQGRFRKTVFEGRGWQYRELRLTRVYTLEGKGSFRGNEASSHSPVKKGKLHFEHEITV
jgi:putative NIF3 family GTP cyclohydrolase 1 type 2